MTQDEKKELIEKCNKLKVKERDERDELFNIAIEECIYEIENMPVEEKKWWKMLEKWWKIKFWIGLLGWRVEK